MSQKPGFIRRLFSGLWGAITWIRSLLANLIFLVIVLVIFAAITGHEPFEMPEKTALRIAPQGLLVDQLTYVDPMSRLMSEDNGPQETRVKTLIDAINRAADDNRVTTLVLDLNYLLGGGISKMEEIGEALENFRSREKAIIAFADSYSQDTYYLASYADEVYINPLGSVFLTGYGRYRSYFKDALDKLQVDFHVFRVGEYKDFIEPFTRNDMSGASREHNSQWLHELWSTYTSHVEERRNLPVGAIDNYINSADDLLAKAEGHSANLAKETGLVDGILNRTGLKTMLTERFGYDEEAEDYQALDAEFYLSVTDEEQKKFNQHVGLVVASGSIMDGDQPAGNIGGDSTARLLEMARNDDSIKAVVLRVDSGGGSAFASEVIREQVVALKQAGKPVVVSMGSVAASGGYWITAGADQVWATPTTITGSIGVFGAFPTLQNSFAKLGIHNDGVGTTELAGIRMDRALPEKAARVIQMSVDNIYQQFLALVADARGTTPEAIHQIAQGRVWTGATAQDIGLVDQLGSLNDAVAAAASLANLSEYGVTEVVKPLSPGEAFMEQLMKNAHVDMGLAPSGLRTALAPLVKPFAILAEMNDPRGVYARCEECSAL
ncbi:signal peptide peptidase SppA [Simiduia agarivorans]|uniref:Signal peptide peptidase SppA, 67K type n=1 Tax=Simiduia agarivorans (strain DSM 21679 / JCM 13881 / BCRC 17597 / SA1) TaxID=1117647 RepID=K4KJE3_SIMAS|nr:signal peptide peptidase SppA [Simiduia agarivorans]AFU98320.1 signal peptide peptidase SppA, 67K type [Simiduia agarivorans SA1 = DSM 21679]